MKIEYGVATIEDLPRIVDIKVAIFKEAGHADLLNDRARPILLKDYRQLYLENAAVHFIARDKDQIVASVGAFIKSDLPFRYFSPAIYGFVGDVFTENDIATVEYQPH